MNDNRTHAATGKACPQALEFFAGIGLARLGLEESGFQVEWSNDIDSAKCEMYRNNFTDTPGHTLVEGDMSELSGDDLPHDAVGVAKGHALAHQIIRTVRGVGKAACRAALALTTTPSV